MFQKFFVNTIETKFIKALLSSIPLPVFNTISDGDYLIAGCYYCYNNNIVLCTRSGVINTERQQGLTCSPDILCGSYLVCGSNGAKSIPAAYDIISSYTLGDRVRKITYEYTNRCNYYDGDTHRYLGDYLRFYRDYTGINLMPFYNCFSYKTSNKFFFSKNGAVVDGENKYYTMHLIPIRYNRTYTIAIDCDDEIQYRAVLYGEYGLLPQNGNSSSKYLFSDLHETSHTRSLSRYSEPFTYRIETTDKDNYSHEGYLYLAMQIPSTNKSTITVLEGDYTDKTKKVINANKLQSLTEKELNRIMLSNLSLLKMNDGNIYAFSDRLLEYLFDSVIDSDDEFYNNVYNTQKLVGLNDRTDTTNGVWDVKMRYKMYKSYINNRLNDPYDINGFVDKDMESYISGGI